MCNEKQRPHDDAITVLQVRLWRLAVCVGLTEDRLPVITECGWKLTDEGYVPLWGTQPAAPTVLLKGLSCKCRATKCQKKQCSCFK